MRVAPKTQGSEAQLLWVCSNGHPPQKEQIFKEKVLFRDQFGVGGGSSKVLCVSCLMCYWTECVSFVLFQTLYGSSSRESQKRHCHWLHAVLRGQEHWDARASEECHRPTGRRDQIPTTTGQKVRLQRQQRLICLSECTQSSQLDLSVVKVFSVVSFDDIEISTLHKRWSNWDFSGWTKQTPIKLAHWMSKRKHSLFPMGVIHIITDVWLSIFKARAPPESGLSESPCRRCGHWCRCNLGVVWNDHPPTGQRNTAKMKRLKLVCDGSVKYFDFK